MNIYNNIIEKEKDMLNITIANFNISNIFIDIEFLITEYYYKDYLIFIEDKCLSYDSLIIIFKTMLSDIKHICIYNEIADSMIYFKCNDYFIHKIAKTYIYENK